MTDRIILFQGHNLPGMKDVEGRGRKRSMGHLRGAYLQYEFFHSEHGDQDMFTSAEAGIVSGVCS